MKILVVPTNRPDSIRSFLDAWEPHKDWDEIVIIEDGPTKTFDLDIKHHYSWREIDEDLRLNSWIISHRDSAIRCYGILIAYRLGAEYIFSLDDDCYPDTMPWCQTHIDALTKTPRWVGSIIGQRTRGMPYENVGVLPNVKFNVGLWTGVPDFDSIQCLSTDKIENFQPPDETRIIPAGQYFPFCGMNFVVHRDAAPLCYFPLMGQSSPFGRFDDIWFGIIAKKVCDHLGWHVSVGQPFVRHVRASDRFANLVKEAPGIRFNEQFWEIVDRIDIVGGTPIDCLREISDQLSHDSLYIPQLGLAIQAWTELFDKEVANAKSNHVFVSS